MSIKAPRAKEILAEVSGAVGRWAVFADEAALPEPVAAALAAQFVSLE